MHVGIDIDETITAAPAFFAFLTRALRGEGHRVTILTLRRCREGAQQTLHAMGVSYDALVTLPDDHDGCVVSWKVDRVHDLRLDVLIDDLTDVANRVRDEVFVLVPRDLAMGFLVHAEGA